MRLSLFSAVALTTFSSLVASVPAAQVEEWDMVVQQDAVAALEWAPGTVSRIGDNTPVHTMTQWDWTDCGNPTDAIEIDSIKISPDPPVPGKDLTIYASGKVKTLITHGSYANVVVKLGLIKLLSKTFDVCDELGNANSTLRCPIDPNTYKVEQTVALPAEIPRAKFVIQANVFTQEDEPAACVNLWINFLLPDRAE
ncbi:BZ3500_MvSof-1268-A1-R1_Chr2-2g04817 [Microbotryum saponariae]|uniref:Phosphatidylglycerol/phosphatidylinositol transfer protein n=1 Tax=Microbotryum saponariae TaxID=289078 RepID=A0A2X0KMQ9_9BASI|nr:BZ3500_MvSof-1268-A1-R1_Chr2-2g04817 [Microbotryum saponariae]SDA00238.1 BZ3501_MvSof-1269-A2-R1_Chr2-2g04491 [Microbotryum saponariae]